MEVGVLVVEHSSEVVGAGEGETTVNSDQSMVSYAVRDMGRGGRRRWRGDGTAAE